MRYVSENVISFSIKVKDREDSVRVNFLPLSAGGSSYSTDVPAVMEALEKSTMYGKVYNRAPECVNDTLESKKPARTAKKKALKVDSVDSWQDAVDYLLVNFGIPGGKLVTPDEILKEAEANGVVFTKLV